MDFIILNSDGSLQKQSLTRYIQQGSHGVDEIFIGWANATSSQTLQAVFTLPNQLTNTELGTFESNYEYEPGETMSGWVITLTENQTRYNGALMVSARIILNGIVQVAYPFALIINETGVMPENDSGITLAQLDSYLLNIQNLVTDAVRQNTDAFLSSTSENPVQNKVITNAIDTLKRGSYTKVNTTEYPTLQDFLNTEGEEGFLYLYPVNTSNEDEGYYQYIWENNLWIPLGTTKIDIANMVTTDTEQTITGQKTFTAKIFVNSISSTNYGENLELFTVEQLKLYGGSYGIETKGSITPVENDKDSLGSGTAQWKDIYLSGIINHTSYNIKWDNGISFRNNSNTVLFYVGSNGQLWIYGDLIPSGTSGTKSLGNSTHCFKDLYLSGNIKGAATMTQAQYDALATKDADTFYFIEEE